LISGAALVLFGGREGLPRGRACVDRGRRGCAGPAFPCGPATAAVIAGGVAMLLLRGRVGRRFCGTVGAVVVAGALVVGAAQVYLSQHRLSDVAASWVLGAALLAVVVVITRTRLAPRPPDEQ
jgi:membrane-associated phospholipid phosphatase